MILFIFIGFEKHFWTTFLKIDQPNDGIKKGPAEMVPPPYGSKYFQWTHQLLRHTEIHYIDFLWKGCIIIQIRLKLRKYTIFLKIWFTISGWLAYYLQPGFSISTLHLYRTLHCLDYIWDLDVTWPCWLQNFYKSEREGEDFVLYSRVPKGFSKMNMGFLLVISFLPVGLSLEIR